MEILFTPVFWIGLLKIIWIDLLLSGDNAVVIALAARSLPPKQQRQNQSLQETDMERPDLVRPVRGGEQTLTEAV